MEAGLLRAEHNSWPPFSSRPFAANIKLAKRFERIGIRANENY